MIRPHMTGAGRIAAASSILLFGIVVIAVSVEAARGGSSTIFTVWLAGSAFAFNALALLARWLVAKGVRRILLYGPIPIATAVMRLACLFALIALLLLWLASLLVENSVTPMAFKALIFCFFYSGVVALTCDGVLNATIVKRYLAGSLAATSRPIVR